MSKSKEYLDALKAKLRTFDWKGAASDCKDLANYLYTTSEQFDLDDAGKLMQQLRNKRLFQLMQEVGDALIQTGRLTYKIRKLYAQALIDQNILTGALGILNELIRDTEHEPVNANARTENREATGLIGRVYKQLYIKAGHPTLDHSIRFLKESIKHYLEAYLTEPQTLTWHGINAVALLNRAVKDGIDVSEYPDKTSIAKEILATIEDRYNNAEPITAWDFATAGEACIALNQPEEALQWYSGYARMPYCDAFELAGTIRQLEEVWQLDTNSEAGRLVLPVLRAELLQREGGCFVINVEELQKQKAVEATTTLKYNALAVRSTEEKKLEKVFGDESFKSYKWYMTGADRCLAVARIGRDKTKGFGTGFLLKGNALHQSLGDELVLITNAHVVSNIPSQKSLRPDDAVIVFEALNMDEEFRVGEIFWSSSSDELDATIIRFSEEDRQRLKDLTKNITIYPLSKHLPLIDSEGSIERIYIIGHPFGGTLQLSFQDNILLDYADPKIHYRTPTVGGSSGSPVFNESWDLIGLHHAGSAEMNRLNGKTGTYEANEGIWIQSVRNALAKTFG